MTGIEQLAARLRNLFSPGDFQKRYDDGRIQVKTRNNRVVEKKEAFPYGFYAKAKGGKVFLFCQGGTLDGFEIFPVLVADDVIPPDLEEGDTAVYTANGGYVILHDAGDVEVRAKGSGKIKVVCEDGKLYVGNGSKDLCALFVGLIDEIKAIVTSGDSSSHTINDATKQKLEAYKNQIKELFEEAE